LRATAPDIDYIIEEIEWALQPLKKLVYKPPAPRPLPASDVIKTHIDIIKAAAPNLQKLRNWRSVRDRARAALRHARALAKLWPSTVAYQVEPEPLANIEGPDPRLDMLQWLCGHGAIVLIEELSEAAVVTSSGGNAHIVAKLLFEAVTGQQPSFNALLQSIKKAKRFRDGETTAAPRLQVRGYFRFEPPTTSN
jgi:hypothetical protein